jgi:hypothetical protein
VLMYCFSGMDSFQMSCDILQSFKQGQSNEVSTGLKLFFRFLGGMKVLFEIAKFWFVTAVLITIPASVKR